MKKANDYLEDANAIVPKISVEEAISKHGEHESLFIDVRDSSDISQTGTIKGALKIPRGFIEFAADDSTPFYIDKIKKKSNIYLVCAAGGMAALTGKTLKEMGYQNVSNIGGFTDWMNAGGPIEN
tara:strand:+ start:150 stop:524 length:375 start_codon:yes stop_codon:yes gene_type:complete